jgi:hypothetical protein
MSMLQRILFISLTLGLVACGGGGSGDDGEKGAGGSPSGAQTIEDNKPATGNKNVEVATVPSLQSAEELVPPGVPSFE